MAWTSKYGPDGFGSADNTALPTHNATWVTDEGVHECISARVRASGVSVSRNSTALANNQAAQIAMYSDSDFHGVGVRYAWGGSDWSAYFAFWNGGTIYLYERSGGSFNLLGSVARALSSGDVLRIEAVGTTMTVLVNGSTITLAATDGTLTSGLAAIRGISAAYGDNFESFEEVAGGKARPLFRRSPRFFRRSF